MSKPTTSSTAADLARRVATDSLLFADAASPFTCAVADGAPTLTVVTGENASGKSLLVRVIGAIAHKAKILPVSVSIRERTGAGLGEMNGMRRIMMFGDESENSTGATSAKVVQTAFGNLERENGSLLILDEPEIGLAESYTRALGELIGQRTREIPAVCAGVVVVTHSRALVRGILDGFGAEPTHLAVAADQDAQAGLTRWLDVVEHRTVDELLALPSVGHERWRTVNQLLGT